MHLDVVTLIAAGSFVAALSGLLLTGAWTQVREPAILWWAAADYVFAAGIALVFYGSATEAVPAVLAGSTLSSLDTGLVWAGTRAFGHRPVRPMLLAVGFGLWFALAAVLFAAGWRESIGTAGFAICIVFLLAANVELWRGRAEPLKARWPLTAVFSLHALIFVGGIYDSILQRVPITGGPPLNSWFGLINFEGLVYAIATAIFMILIAKERVEHGYLSAAERDALTGVANCGAFFAGAERLLDRCRGQDAPLSVIEFDLDGFKSINDSHGHAVGDKVLRIFVESTRGVLRPNDFFGRHGGEEFAVVLPGATVETAYVIAERACRAFAEASRTIDGRRLNATVSAGVAAAALAENFSAALEAADRALYKAKSRGRNRVERADDRRSSDGASVIRLA